MNWHGHRFEVFVGENDPPHRIGWLGIGAGVQLYQGWLITAAEDGTLILTANVVRSAAPKALDTLSATWLKQLNALWLAQIESERVPDPASECTASARRVCGGRYASRYSSVSDKRPVQSRRKQESATEVTEVLHNRSPPYMTHTRAQEWPHRPCP
ncbi:hypothetical protein ACIQZB_40425 [Streptomyces sp. NPDC097727]|uniref:hypothetical protein n=1 Tax=Streptomyces sp. NPDC097727 TaxID=3366092 RepID=UPI0037FD9C0E